MSAPLFRSDILFLQRFLKCCGYYDAAVDGIWGPLTHAAMDAFDRRTEEIAAEAPTFDGLSERCIRSLQPRAQQRARQFLATLLAGDISARIISGTRTYAEQNALFRRGRYGNPGPRVTNARGGQSKHNFGIAWDIGIFERGRYVGDSALYDRAAEVGLGPGLEWGGDWAAFRDRPHYQLATGLGTLAIRQHFESGTLAV